MNATRSIWAALFLGAAFSVAAAQAQDAPDVPLEADIVVMGELHDIALHHDNQAAWVARMAPAAVVFEMLPPELADIAEDMRGADAGTLGAALTWEERGWPDFPSYHPIFTALGEARIYGAEVPRDDLSRAVSQGAAAVFGDGAERFLLDLDLPLEEQTLREDLQDRAHCGLMPPEMLPGMVEVQRLRDAVLARTALTALDETGGPVAIITGNGHARTDWGVPSYLRAADPDVTVHAIGQVLPDDEAMPFDTRLSFAVDLSHRGDPCDALR